MIRWAPDKGHPSSALLRIHGSVVGGAVMWFETHGGEPKSHIHHYAYVHSDIEAGELTETNPSGTKRTELGSYDRDGVWGVLVEHVGWPRDQHRMADGVAADLEDLPYNFVSIVTTGLDGLLGKVVRRDVYLFRRFHLPWIRMRICSGIGVRIHRVAGWRFMAMTRVWHRVTRHGRFPGVIRIETLRPLPERRATPDCLWDDVFLHRPHHYRVRGEINPDLRPDDLPAAAGAKIAADLTRADSA